MSSGISVIIPAYNTPQHLLRRLYDSLCAQAHPVFEVLLVDDASTEADYGMVQDSRFRVLRQERNRGPAACRNVGAAAAQYELLLFTDDDCELAPGALAEAVAALARDEIIAGDTVTRVNTAFGKAVALMGFPGGGVLGFDKVWRVDPDGCTDHFSSCNVAFRKNTYFALGCFNEDFPVAGGEDTLLCHQAIASGHCIRYWPRLVVYHVERSSLRGFIRWQLVRGRGNYYIRQHVPAVGGYLKLRLWTFSNSFRAAGLFYAPAVFLLIVLSVLCQSLGYRQERRKQRHAASLPAQQ